MFVKISAPQGAIKKESAAVSGRLVQLDDREVFVNVGASHLIQVKDQEIIFDLVKIQFQTKEHTAAAAEVLRAAIAQGIAYVEINEGVASVVFNSKLS